MLILQNLSYSHPDKELLFDDISLTVETQAKIALTGKNGSGKSTLLKIVAGQLPAASGIMKVDSQPYYIPQIFGQFNHLSVAEALQVDEKLGALHAILHGNVSEKNLAILNDDWNIEERCREALDFWDPAKIPLNENMNQLSGGQKTKVFLAGVMIHHPKFVLLDEPSNHLDSESRQLLYKFILDTSLTLIVVSHDRALLNLLSVVCELGSRGIAVYGGNYDFYMEQKKIENTALQQDLRNKEKTLRKAREKAHETLERQRKLDARGKKKQEKAGMPTIMLNTLRNNAEKSTAKVKEVHREKTDSISADVERLRDELPELDMMKLNFRESKTHKGKVLFRASGLNYRYDHECIWENNLDFEVLSGSRIVLKGKNGSGKTTLIKILSGFMEPSAGTIYRAGVPALYIDQQYSLVQNGLTVYRQAQEYNDSGLQEHEIKSRLSRFLFDREEWDKPCTVLSGGEKMRLTLCCLTIKSEGPQILFLDEPTNNLDIQNLQILTAAIKDYGGTIIVVSHDDLFLEEISITGQIILGKRKNA